MKPLGRLQPTDWDHVAKYPITALAAVPTPGDIIRVDHPTVDLRPRGVPVVLGTNWYEGMDTPVERSGHYMIDGSDLGSVRGGHCYVLEPADAPKHKGIEKDNDKWWQWYNQGQEGACVGFGCSRAASLIHRHQYDAWWLYDQARILDGDPEVEGSQVRSGLEVLRTQGHRTGSGRVNERSEHDSQVDPANGIKVYRWAIDVEDVLHALGTPNSQYVTILNSWGRDYPHRTRMSVDVLHRLLRESGEAAIITEQ
jgi:hypothetical protein